MSLETKAPLERISAVGAVLDRLEGRLDTETSEALRRARSLTDSYLPARLGDIEAPFVVLVVGASGVGKSTIVNSLAGRAIVEVGIRRPTTTKPAVWSGGRPVPSLEHARRSVDGVIVESLRTPPRGSVIIDTPPPDAAGQALDRLIESADGCVLVVSASRYADEAGLALAAAARRRDLPIAVVLNRHRPTDATVVDDLRQKLTRRGLVFADGRASMHVVHESEGDPEVLDPGVVASLADTIAGWAGNDAVRQALIAGSLAALDGDLAAVRSGLLEAEVRRIELDASVEVAYRRKVVAFLGEVKVGRFEKVNADDACHAMAVALTRAAGRGALAAAEAWERLAPEIMEARPDLYLPGPDTPETARAEIDAWSAGSSVGGLSSALRRLWLDVTLDPSLTLGWRDRRRLKRRPRFRDVARASLEVAAKRVLAADADRYRSLVAEPPPPGLLGSLRIGWGGG